MTVDREKQTRNGCEFFPGVTICGALRPATLTRGRIAMRNHIRQFQVEKKPTVKGTASKLRGHSIYLDGELWRYADDGVPTSDTWRSRPCGRCGEFSTTEGHDNCLGTLPGVMNACCGHGVGSEAYVQFCDGSIVSGRDAVVILDGLTKGE